MKQLKLTLTLALIAMLTLVMVFSLSACSDDDSATSAEGLDELEYVDAEARVVTEEEFDHHSTSIAQVGNLVLDESTGDIKLSWDAVEDAVEYEIFRSDHPDSYFGRLARVEETNFTDPEPLAGKTNHYKVRAVKYVHGTEKFGHLSSGVQVDR